MNALSQSRKQFYSFIPVAKSSNSSFVGWIRVTFLKKYTERMYETLPNITLMRALGDVGRNVFADKKYCYNALWIMNFLCRWPSFEKFIIMKHWKYCWILLNHRKKLTFQVYQKNWYGFISHFIMRNLLKCVLKNLFVGQEV